MPHLPELSPNTPDTLDARLRAASPRYSLPATPLRSYLIHGSILLLWLGLFAMAFRFTGVLAWSTGIVYVVYTIFSGEWRYLMPRRRSFREAWLVLLHDLVGDHVHDRSLANRDPCDCDSQSHDRY